MPVRCSSLYRPFSLRVRLASTQRRAQNLSERYRKLENNTRTKPGSPQPNGPALTRTTPPDTIAGFVIPKEPRAPADDECCMSGCAVCVYDLYEDALSAYKESVMTLRAALAERDIPETEWPAHMRTPAVDGKAARTMEDTRTRGVVLDAFEEMERALKEKRDRRAAVESEKRARGERTGLGLREVYEGIKWVVFPSR